MTQAEAVLLVYCIMWTIIGHWYVLRRWELRRKKKRRSIAARKAAATRKMNGRGRPRPEVSKKAPKPRAKKKPLEDNVVTTDSAWFVLDDEDEPDYNEQIGVPWTPTVRRFDGTAREYAARDQSDGSV